MVLGLFKLTSLALNVAVNPWSQTWPMEMMFRLSTDRNTLKGRGPMENLGKGRRAV